MSSHPDDVPAIRVKVVVPPPRSPLVGGRWSDTETPWRVRDSSITDPVVGERRRVLLEAYRRHQDGDDEGTADLQAVCVVLATEGFTGPNITAVIDPDTHALGQNLAHQRMLNRVHKWMEDGRARYDVSTVNRVVYRPELTADELSQLARLTPEVQNQGGMSPPGGAGEAARIKYDSLLIAASLRGVRPGTMSNQLDVPYVDMQPHLTSAWRRWVASLPDEPDPFIGTILRQDPASRRSAMAPTQFHLAAGSGYAADSSSAPIGSGATHTDRRAVLRRTLYRTPLRPPPYYDFSAENTPGTPKFAPPAAPVPREIGTEHTGRHHDATRSLRAAAEKAGHCITTPSRGQDASFITGGTLVNIETKTVTLAAADPRSNGQHKRQDSPGEVTARFTDEAVRQLRLGLGQVLEQVQLHRDDLDAQWGLHAREPVERCAAVLAVELGQRGPDAPWSPIDLDQFDPDTADVWDRWLRTCAQAGVTLITVADLERLVAAGSTDWASMVDRTSWAADFIPLFD